MLVHMVYLPGPLVGIRSERIGLFFSTILSNVRSRSFEALMSRFRIFEGERAISAEMILRPCPAQHKQMIHIQPTSESFWMYLETFSLFRFKDATVTRPHF